MHVDFEHLRENHAIELEKLVNELMVDKKEMENMLRGLKRLEAEREKLINDKEIYR